MINSNSKPSLPQDQITTLLEDAKDKRSKEHSINLEKLKISYKILCWIFGLMITIFGIRMATLILGYIAGSQLGK